MRSVLRSSVDLLMWPQISRFVLVQALRLDKAELLHGAALSACAVNDATRSAITGDETALDELASSGALVPDLHGMLAERVRDGKLAGKLKTDAMLSGLERQRSALVDVKPTLSSLRLIVGANRSEFRGHSSTSMNCLPSAGYYIEVGSYLVVVDDVSHGMWRVDRQRDLLRERGCSVQFTITFAPSTPLADTVAKLQPVAFTFEAFIRGQDLVGRKNDSEESSSATAIALADIISAQDATCRDENEGRFQGAKGALDPHMPRDATMIHFWRTATPVVLLGGLLAGK